MVFVGGVLLAGALLEAPLSEPLLHVLERDASPTHLCLHGPIVPVRTLSRVCHPQTFEPRLVGRALDVSNKL